MELKNANSNACNVIIDNLHPMILFFQKILNIELNNRDFKVCFRIENP